DCLSHDPYDPIRTLDARVCETRLGDLLERVRSDLGPTAVVEFNTDLLAALACPACREEEALFTSLGKVKVGTAKCPHCGADRVPRMFHTISGEEKFLDHTLAQIGVPAWDVLTGRC